MRRFIGLDLHKGYVHGYVWEPNKEGRHFRFPNSSEGWSSFVEKRLRPTDWVAMEMTGNAFQAYDMISPHADKVLLANSNELKRLGSGRHTDKVDAKRLAQMMAVGSLPTVWIPPEQVREMRELCNHRERLVRDRTRLKNRVKSVLQRNGIALPRNADPVKWLKEQYDPENLPESAKLILADSLELIEHVSQRIEAVDKEINRRAASNESVKILMSLPGVGPVIASAVWAIIGDAARFDTSKQITRYAGLDPSVYQSGHTNVHGKISKNGSPLLRKLLVQAAYQHIRTAKGPLVEFYRRRKRYISSKAAAVALARKILIIAWRMLQSGELYKDINTSRYAKKLNELEKFADSSPHPYDEILDGFKKGGNAAA